MTLIKDYLQELYSKPFKIIIIIDLNYINNK
jgi:hypothetical protein